MDGGVDGCVGGGVDGDVGGWMNSIRWMEGWVDE